MSRESRHGRPADGWVKLGIQLPENIAEPFRQLASQAGLGGSKTLMTVAVGLLVALPEADRDALARYVIQQTYRRPDGLNPDELLSFLAHIIQSRPKPAHPDPRWEVLYIADPELTPPPGQKASDRARANREKRA